MKNKLVKYFLIICLVALVIYILIYTVAFVRGKKTKTLTEWFEDYPDAAGRLNLTRPSDSLKYILQWSSGDVSPFHFMGKGRSAFITNNCTHTNCFVTDENILFDYRLFHAIAFNGHQVIKSAVNNLPKIRSPLQKYIFAAMESSHYYPACTPYLDGFFNWTWTYRLDSDVRWGYITLFHMNGSVAGPKENILWPDRFEEIDAATKVRLKSKSKAAAWFVSNCETKSNRESVARQLGTELHKLGLYLDIYGVCGKHKCSRSRSDECLQVLERDYYFYLSFENSFSKDYVTEKVLTPLNHLTVPLVYGSANYSKFLPPGSYLNAMELGPAELARQMAAIIKNSTAYYDFFRWRNHYYYKETAETLDICNLCALLNDDEKFKTYSTYKEFRKWWNPSEDSC